MDLCLSRQPPSARRGCSWLLGGGISTYRPRFWAVLYAPKPHEKCEKVVHKVSKGHMMHPYTSNRAYTVARRNLAMCCIVRRGRLTALSSTVPSSQPPPLYICVFSSFPPLLCLSCARIHRSSWYTEEKIGTEIMKAESTAVAKFIRRFREGEPLSRDRRQKSREAMEGAFW